MAVGKFIIQEQPSLEGFIPRSGAVRFEWDSDHRSSPVQPWSGGVHQRTARVDYPGSDNPTEQVLGPNFKPFTLSGRWQDKFNGGAAATLGGVTITEGFAIKTFNAFLAMVRRGNVVQISFKSLVFIGIITDFDWDYRREYDIGYSFTFSPHRRPGADELAKPPSPRVTRDAKTLSKKVEQRIKTDMAAIAVNKPSTQIAGDISPLTSAQLAAMESASDEFQFIVNHRILRTDADADLSVLRAIASGDLLIGRASLQITGLSGLSSDTSLMYQTPLGVLGLETWARGTAASSRLVVFDSYDARQQLDEQAQPDAIALYQPFKGESLYSVSNRFYNTPHNWRLIKERNLLPSSNMTGTEILIIPEAPPQ